jgi:hypothetical protein
MKMKSKSTMNPAMKSRMEFKGNLSAVKKAQKADDKSDKKIAKKFGVKRAY